MIDIDYMKQCGEASSVPFIANGDVYSWQDAVKLREQTKASAVMVARGAIIKPWVFKEIKEQKDYDISGSERMDMIQDFVRFGLEHWGSDQRGIENIRHFLLNWMSFLCRYVPVGIIEHFPVAINHVSKLAAPPWFLWTLTFFYRDLLLSLAVMTVKLCLAVRTHRIGSKLVRCILDQFLMIFPLYQNTVLMPTLMLKLSFTHKQLSFFGSLYQHPMLVRMGEVPDIL